MIYKIIALILVVGLTVTCTYNPEDIITISEVSDGFMANLPLEFNIESEIDSDQLIAESIENQQVRFILQKTRPVFSDNSNSYSTILPKSITDGQYKIRPYKEQGDFELRENVEGRITLLESGKPVLNYNYGMQLNSGVPERYKRSTYVHPIYDLDGNILTDDFPDDHYHHRGLSWMWPKVFIDTVRYDLWHIYGQKGELNGIHQKFEKWMIKEVGPVCATIGAKNYWELDGGSRVMDEWIYLKIFKADSIRRVIDIKLTWVALDQISIEGQTKKGYGGLNFRFAPRRETQITSKFGKEEDSDLKSLPWADQSAKFADSKDFSGASILQDESNNNYPAGWCLRHYGFLGVAWPGVDRYNMNIGDSLSLSFKVVIHRGNASESDIAEFLEIIQNQPIIE